MARRSDENEAEPHAGAVHGSQAAPASRWTRAQTQRAIDRLDERERRLSFAAAGLAAIFGIVIYVSETTNPHFRLAKNQLTPQTTLIFGLAAAGLLVITTLIGRRAPVGFVALFTFLAFGTQYLLGVPFLALAVWLLYRSFKIQREAAAAARAARAEGSGPRAPSSARSSDRSPSAPKTARAKGRASSGANKRYTPKRPSPPPPKPSWRERKAAQSKPPPNP